MRGLDYSAGRIPGSAIKAAGYGFVVRYVEDPAQGLNNKHIRPDEFHDLTSNGVTVWLVHEVGTTDWSGGFAAGVDHARRARAGADWIGYPKGGVIFFCADMHLTANQIPVALAYLDGAASVLGRGAVGCYGFYELVDAAIAQGKAAYYWQCGIAPDASDPVHIWQRNDMTTVVSGVACDVNELLRPIGGPVEEDDMDFNTSRVDWAGNTQTLGSTLDNLDRRLAELYHDFHGGDQPSRIPGDKNTTDWGNAIMDSVARTSIAEAVITQIAPTITGLQADVAAIKQAITNIQTPQVDMDALAQAVAAHLSTLQFKAQ